MFVIVRLSLRLKPELFYVLLIYILQIGNLICVDQRRLAFLGLISILMLQIGAAQHTLCVPSCEKLMRQGRTQDLP